MFIDPAQFISNEQTVQEHPEVASNLKTPASLEWLDATSKSNMILSAILAVIHPELYKAGQEVHANLRNDSRFQRHDVNFALDRWGSAFTGVAVISNRVTPDHRDGGSRKQWYDILVTLGPYRDCKLKFAGLGVNLDYGPGTVIGLSGMVLQHAVPEFQGERLCYAYFMKDNVHEWAGVSGYTWMNISHYE